MKNISASIAVLCFLGMSFTAISQNARGILDQLSAKAKTYKNIEASYSSHLIDKQAGLDLSQQGSIKINGDQYILDLNDYLVVTDGSVIWTYEKAQNTCSVDYLEDMGDDVFQPSKIFTIWEDDFKVEHKGVQSIAGRKLTQINLYPNNPKEKSYHTIQLFVDEAKMEVAKIIIKERDGSEQVYEMKTFKTNVTFPEGTFQYKKSQYPGVEMIDNRI